MSRVHHIDLQYEIDSRHESIRGEMRDRQGRTLPFTGWTEFSICLMELTGNGDEPDHLESRSSEEQ